MTVLEDSWIDEWGSIVKLHDLDQDALIRCRLCDLTENGVPLGSCSAHVVKRSGGSQGVWCWSCQSTFWEYHETPRLVPSWPPAETRCLDGNPPNYLGGCVLDATFPEHRRHGRPRCTDMIPLDVLFESRVTCLDAPTGYGKTYLLVDLVNNSPNSRVMVIASWTSLCNYYKCLLDRETRVTWSLYAEGSVKRWNPATDTHVIIAIRH